MVRPQNDHQRIRDRNREERFLIQPGVRIDHEHIQRQIFDQLLESFVQDPGIVAFFQELDDFAGFHAGRGQEDLARDRHT